MYFIPWHFRGLEIVCHLETGKVIVSTCIYLTALNDLPLLHTFVKDGVFFQDIVNNRFSLIEITDYLSKFTESIFFRKYHLFHVII